MARAIRWTDAPLSAIEPGRVRPIGNLERALHQGVFQDADILLMHRFNDPGAWVIRLLSGSYWNHAALIRDEGGQRGLQLIEAHWTGIRRWPLAEFLERHSRKSLIAIRRAPSSVLSPSTRQRITDLAAQAVGLPYDFSLLLRLGILSISDLVRRQGGGRPSVGKLAGLATRLASQGVRAFTCSGLIQWAYYMGGDPSAGERVLFVPQAPPTLPAAILREATPEHLASAPGLEWAYVLWNDQVWALSDDQRAVATT